MGSAHQRIEHHHDDVGDRIDEILAILRAQGGRVTTGRRAIVAALLGGADHHVTAEAVALAVQAEHPDVHLSTIYRTLDALESLGVVDRVNLGSGGALYHLTDHVHHHLVCDDCASVVEIPRDQLSHLRRSVLAQFGFALADQGLVLRGRCQSCQTLNPEGPSG